MEKGQIFFTYMQVVRLGDALQLLESTHGMRNELTSSNEKQKKRFPAMMQTRPRWAYIDKYQFKKSDPINCL